ncbi:MAG: polyhydroxyalkanoate synthesis repressor PhaR [Rhodospirillales bacterium CG15_BIG_FIL_POST_REV_8_21_14_020_66_15]|nr:MAG: polyhydroxyalkanoate synthesis repressor PhaR [Rhodospirillales bacterium CG15_BIG_FIL_POST_REV_8_21_14_020_66_15]
MAEKKPAEGEPITIKKYANRRLYNTATSSYVTLDYLAQMVKDGDEFVVNDAKTGEDITRQVLTHIIVEEESKGTNLLPISFLRHLISFYGDSLQAVVPNYLEHTMQSFATNQEALRKTMQEALEGFNPFGQFEEVSKQNMVLFENAMKMFSPFYAEGKGVKPKTNNSNGGQGAADIDEMRAKLEEMQRQLDSLSGDNDKK